MSDGFVSASVSAGPIRATGNGGTGTHQFIMGHRLYIHITPEVAAQWIQELGTITEGKDETPAP